MANHVSPQTPARSAAGQPADSVSGPSPAIPGAPNRLPQGSSEAASQSASTSAPEGLAKGLSKRSAKRSEGSRLKISLCLIARNEERLLAGCLESVQGVVDEIVLVDTGSTDRTMEIARSFGAKVFELPWANDFSAPRNLSLQKATGDWVLVLDADERLAPGAGDTLHALIAEATFDCGMLNLHDAASLDSSAEAVLSGDKRLGTPVMLPRVLRRTPDLAFFGVVHEGVDKWLAKRGFKVGLLDVHVVHFGQTPEVRAQKGKKTRNMDLLRKRCQQEPENITPYGYLALELLFDGQLDEARRVVEDGWALVDVQPSYRSLLRVGVARARLMLFDKKAEEALETIAVCEKRDPNHPDLHFLKGCSYEMRAQGGRWELDAYRDNLRLAAEAFTKAVGLTDVPTQGQFIAGATSWAAWTRLGTVYLCQGRPETALAEFERVQEDSEAYLEARYGRVEALIDLGRYQEALAGVESLLTEPYPDGWLLAASATEALGSYDDMTRFFELSRKCSKGFLGFHRLYRHADLIVLSLAAAGRPEAGPGGIGLLAALMARQPTAHTVVQPTASEVERVARLVLSCNQATLLDALLEPRAEALVPGLRENLVALLQAWGLSVEDDGEPSPVFVVSPEPADAAPILEALRGHDRLQVKAHALQASEALRSPGDLREALAVPREGVRPIFSCADDADLVKTLNAAYPRACVVRVVAPPSSPLRLARPSDTEPARLSDQARSTSISVKAFRTNPDKELQTLYAFLGEARPETAEPGIARDA